MSRSSSSSSSVGIPPLPSADGLPWILLLRIKECFVYPILARTSIAGHVAETWGLENPAFTGELHIVAKDEALVIRLLSGNDHYADSVPLDGRTVGRPKPLDAFIEPVRDSSRYFVIRVKDVGTSRVGTIGIGFRERSDAFDMMAAITDRVHTVQRLHDAEDIDRANAAANADEIEAATKRLAAMSVDRSLAPGQRIKVPLKLSNNETKPPPSSLLTPQAKIAVKALGSGFGLAPPPPSTETGDEIKDQSEKKKSKKKNKAKQSAQADIIDDDEDEWQDFSSAPKTT